MSSSGLTSDGYLCADGQSSGNKEYEEHQYVNTQSLENLDSLAQGSDGQRRARAPDSPKKDLFDMSEPDSIRVNSSLNVKYTVEMTILAFVKHLCSSRAL